MLGLFQMKTAISALLILALLLAGCSSNQVVTTLQLVVVASEAAVASLEATGQIDLATAVQITRYLTAVSTATSDAATELQSNDMPAVKATKITQEFATIIAPTLPPGTAQSIIAVVQAVTQAVANFLAAIQPAAAGTIKLTISASDKAKLDLIKQRSGVVKLKLQRRPQ